MPAKRPGDEDVAAPIAAKALRNDLAPPQEHDVQAGARRKGASNRTGQACDRCKVRKIRCDPQPGGCSPCAQNNTECRTTDRITGLIRSRGHTENVEVENANLRSQIDILQKQLRDQGIDPIQPSGAPSGYTHANTDSYTSPVDPPSSSWGSLQHNERLPAPPENVLSQPKLVQEFRTGCIGDNYLGVSSGNDWLSPIEGTSLSLFGATLDLNEFIPEDRVDSGTSYQNFLDHAFIEKQKNAPQLPPWERSKQFAEWYFRSIQPMLPILHKPDFMKLLSSVYHEGHRPSAAESVMVHMVMSLVTFQYTTRNSNPQQRSQDFKHWFYSLSLVPRLIKGHTLADMQGLTLICAQLRAFPRPGACWMFTNTVLGLAIELGLHRSVTAWKGATAQQDPHTIEMRKRIFWSLMLMHVPVSGKLGRPMPLRPEDFDIEIPEEIPDNLPDESHFDDWRKCSFRAGKWGFVLLRVQMRVYSSIYSIGSTSASYEASVKQLEAQLKETVATFPPELSGGPETKDEDRVSALYLQLQATGCQLLIHHPALCRSPSPQVMSDNIDACLDASNKMLSIASQLKQLKSLDSTLYWNMDFLASMFTMLFAYTERADRLNLADLHRLRQDMKGWLDVMGFVGNLLGSGDRLHTYLRNLVEWSINNISKHLGEKPAPAVVASSATPPATDSAPQKSVRHTPVYQNGHDYTQSYSNGSSREMSSAHSQSQMQAQSQPQPQTQAQPQPQPQPQSQPQPQPQPQSQVQAPAPMPSNPYSAGQPYSYADPQNSGVPAFVPATMQPYSTQPYATEDVKPNIEAQLAHAALQQPHPVSQAASGNYMGAYPISAAQYPTMDFVGPSAWRTFAANANMAMGMQVSAAGMDNVTYAGGIMTDPMGNTTPKNGSFMYPTGTSFGQMQMPSQDGSNNVAEWPMIQFN